MSNCNNCNNCTCTCSCNNNTTVSTANVAVSTSVLLITPTETLSPENESRVAVKIINSVPADGVTLPVEILLNGANVPVYDKFGNVLYGYGIRPNTVLKGFFGNNGAGATAHLQLVNYPFIRCP
jgi:hypothetical protein